MTRRLVRWLVFLAVASLASWVGATGAIAEGAGDPHAGDRGDPHATEVRGDPHDGADAVEQVLAMEVASPSADVVPASPKSDLPEQAAAESAKPDDPGPAGDPDPPQTGQPDPGTVGNADDKEPKGQSPNDKNRGYECDDNKGIGRGNPAHTANCPAAPVKPPVTPTVTPTTPTPAVVQATSTAAPAAQVLGVQFERAASPAPAALARTGANLEAQLAFAVVLLLGGTVLLLATRRRTPRAA